MKIEASKRLTANWYDDVEMGSKVLGLGHPSKSGRAYADDGYIVVILDDHNDGMVEFKYGDLARGNSLLRRKGYPAITPRLHDWLIR